MDVDRKSLVQTVAIILLLTAAALILIHIGSILKKGNNISEIRYEDVNMIRGTGVGYVITDNPLRCLFDVQMISSPSFRFHIEDTQEKPCDPDFVKKLLDKFVEKGIQIGAGKELMAEIRTWIETSINGKFGW